ncbi:MAG TPA: FAD-dependent monooxygenase, partial [Usitatibacter sp.]|nr:FAD-dependent monooxygenase [Usitatibacter sp.]
MENCQTDCEVLIAGAGPTGLVLALWLNRYGIRVRIVDKAAEPGTTSRALAVHARTLELYDMIGLGSAVLEASRKMAAANLWVADRKIAHLPFGDMGKGLSPHPYAVIFPQDEHEKLLIERLRAAGVRVEREVEVVGIDEERDHFVTARLRGPDGGESLCRSAFLAGCDGAHSFMREAVHAGFPGGTYEHVFYVADVAATGPVADGELHGSLEESDFIAVFPLKADGHLRLVGTVHDEAAKRRDLGWDDVSKDILERMKIEVRKVNWFSTYHVHHRVANDFRSGRVFLLGDAAHIHSPVGGQGMNTGIGDAINLAWKLASVLKGRAADALLETYSPERRAFALQLVASTDRAFTFITRNGALARFVRLHVVPLVLPPLFLMPAARRAMFRTISQTAIEYRSSAVSSGSAGRIHAGDRLPWVAPDAKGAPDNYAPLASMDWQVHVHGMPSSQLVEACGQHGVPLHAFRWRDEAGAAGYPRGAAFLVRPDG